MSFLSTMVFSESSGGFKTEESFRTHLLNNALERPRRMTGLKTGDKEVTDEMRYSRRSKGIKTEP